MYKRTSHDNHRRVQEYRNLFTMVDDIKNTFEQETGWTTDLCACVKRFERKKKKKNKGKERKSAQFICRHTLKNRQQIHVC